MKYNNATSIYKLTDSNIIHLLKVCNPLICLVCNKPITLGQTIVTNHHNNLHLRHLSCAKRVGLI